MNKELKPKRTHLRTGSIAKLGAVCYTAGGAFYVPLQVDSNELNICSDMHITTGVYRLKHGGFFDEYTERMIDMNCFLGDIYDETFKSMFIEDLIMPQIVDSYTIHSFSVLARIVQRCIN